MGRKVFGRNTLTYGELPSFEARNPGSKRYRDGLLTGQGIDIIPGQGAKASKGPSAGAFATTPISYRCDNIRGTLNLRNSTVGSTPPLTPDAGGNNPFWPVTDSGTEGALIDNLLAAAFSTGNFRSRPDASDTPSWGSYPFGKLDVNKTTLPGGGAITPVLPTGTYVSVASPFKYYRGMRPGLKPGAGGSALISGWGLIGLANCRWKATLFGVDDGSGTDQYKVLCRGNGGENSRYESGGAYVTIVWGSVQLTEFIVQPGVYLLTQDVYLIGGAKMFTVLDPGHGFDGFNGKCMNYGKTVHSVSANVDVEYGYLPPEDNHPILGYGVIDTPTSPNVDAANVAFTSTKQSAAGSLFYFKGRTIVKGERRFGRASLYAQEQYLGTSRIGNGTDRDVAPMSPADTDPYVLQLDSAPIWYEAAAQGIVVGTAMSEYLVSNEQIKSAVRLQRISTVGSPVPHDNLTSASCMFEGNIYYISRYGITTIPFSNEAQAYLPRHFKTEGLRMNGAITSLAASLDERCLYFVAADGTLWKLWPDTGAMAGVNLLPGDSRLKGVIQRDGAVYCVFSEYDASVTPALYVGDYFAPVNSVRTGQSVIETTAFARGPGIVASVKKVVLELSATKGGTVQLTGAGIEPARPVPYTVDQLVDGATGVIEILVGGRPGARNEGRPVKIVFEETDEFHVVAVGAEVEVN